MFNIYYCEFFKKNFKFSFYLLSFGIINKYDFFFKRSFFKNNFTFYEEKILKEVKYKYQDTLYKFERNLFSYISFLSYFSFVTKFFNIYKFLLLVIIYNI